MLHARHSANKRHPRAMQQRQSAFARHFYRMPATAICGVGGDAPSERRRTSSRQFWSSLLSVKFTKRAEWDEANKNQLATYAAALREQLSRMCIAGAAACNAQHFSALSYNSAGRGSVRENELE